MRMRHGARRRLFPSPVRARHIEYSMLYSEDDALSHPNERLMDIASEAIAYARRTDVQDICRCLRDRFSYPSEAINLWPGEHYRLMAGLLQALRPKLVIEIGTAEGISALSMLKYLPPESQIVTFDIIPWGKYPRSCLTGEDFAGGRLRQIVDDLGEREVFQRHFGLLDRADLVFVDAAKDGVLEPKLMTHFETLTFRARPLFVFDDIRLWNMLAVWRAIRWPKLDLTSFGHWCGTGLCAPMDEGLLGVSQHATETFGCLPNQ